MEGILNETTRTLHRRKGGGDGLESECGVTHHLESEALHTVPIEVGRSAADVSRCGRCFDDAGGY